MNFKSILNLRSSGKEEKSRPGFFIDLNLDQVIKKIETLFGEDIADFYYYFPLDKECEEYRRQVYSDISIPDNSDALNEFYSLAKQSIALNEKQTHFKYIEQRCAFRMKEIYIYCKAFRYLSENLNIEKLHSEGMRSFYSYLTEYVESECFRQMEAESAKLVRDYETVKLTLRYENGKLQILDGEAAPFYEDFLKTRCQTSGKSFKSPFSYSEELTTLENEIIVIYKKKNPDLFKNLNDFYERYSDYSDAILMQFVKEIAFFLSFNRFERMMKENGFVFCIPDTGDDDDFSGEGLFDLALACKNLTTNEPVIPNSFELRKGENFFVLTGPNQGGKTTFARSLGQLVYFSKMGLSVPGARASVPYFKTILTHFSVEESIETGRGKLKEELIRLSPMMKETGDCAFVIINELFTTAANYDACIMGRNVLNHFISKGCRGIYVTHLEELYSAHESIVSLVACLDETRRQSFKIERSNVSVKGCAINQVNKYRLGYADLKERLSV